MHIISYNLNVPATHNPTLRLRSTCAAVHVSAYLLFPLGRWQAQALVSLTACMSDEHVSYKANLQTASTKYRATMGPPAKRFSDGVFLCRPRVARFYVPIRS